MIIAVVGPTGVGKTKMSISLAKKYDAVVVNADSMQVYKYLNASEEVAENLVDILYSGTRKDCLVFVFKKTPLMKELYRKWNAHK